MFSKDLRNQFVEAAKDIRKSHEQFVKAYASACVECGGNDWKNGDYRTYFKVIRKELKPALVDEGLLPSSVFYKHCLAAELSLVFEIPWSFANQAKADDLSEIKVRFDADDSDDALAVKFKRALDSVRREKRASRRSNGVKALPQPIPDDTGASFGYRLCKCLCEFSSLEAVSPFMKGDKAVPLVTQLIRCAEMTVELHEADRQRKATPQQQIGAQVVGV
jgi:hypothetical protein